MHYSSRIRTRAAGMKNGKALLEIASRPEVRQEMFRRIAVGEKPVTALSVPMIETFGEEARDDGLRRLAGEVTAHIVETEHQCIRASGSHKILGDLVFTSGQPFRHPDLPKLDATNVAPKVDSPELLVRFLSDESLENLAHLITAEIERRAA